MKLYWIGDRSYQVVPANHRRTWIENSDRAAFKCRPLRDASRLGWHVLLPSDVQASWDGGRESDSVTINCSNPNLRSLVTSHFRHGILTFIFPFVVRTDPGYDLFLSGPINEVRDGVVPLSAIIETDWLPFHFSMSWRFSRPNVSVNFRSGDPIAQMYVVKRVMTSTHILTECDLAEDPVLAKQYREWLEARNLDAFKYAINGEPQRPLGFYERREFADGTDAEHGIGSDQDG